MTDKKKESSIVGELSSGFDATEGVNDYDPVTQEGQIGKAYEERVTQENIWEKDNHNPTGLPIPSEVKSKAIAGLKSVLDKISQLEEITPSIEEKEYEKAVEQIADDTEIKELDTEETILNIAKEEESMHKGNVIKAAKLLVEATNLLKDALHPAEPRVEEDFEKAKGSPQMGDDIWVDIGSAIFDDARDQIGKPA